MCSEDPFATAAEASGAFATGSFASQPGMPVMGDPQALAHMGFAMPNMWMPDPDLINAQSAWWPIVVLPASVDSSVDAPADDDASATKVSARRKGARRRKAGRKGRGAGSVGAGDSGAIVDGVPERCASALPLPTSPCSPGATAVFGGASGSAAPLGGVGCFGLASHPGMTGVSVQACNGFGMAVPAAPPQMGTWLRRMPSVPESDPRQTLEEEDEDEDESEEKMGSEGASSTAADPLQEASPPPAPFFPEGISDPMQLIENKELSEQIIARLDSTSKPERGHIVEWIVGAAKPLALDKHGTRVVQKALEVASNSDRVKLHAALEPHVEDLYVSLHGNHALTRLVEVMPSATIGPVIAQLQSQATTVARHRFGCRVLERLIEHCSEPQISALVDQIVAESDCLCRHPYGNFVVQHILEHGSPSRRTAILHKMLGMIPTLAMHRTASHVVQKALDYSSEEGQSAIIRRLLDGERPTSLAEVACSRYGSFVVEQLASIRVWSDEVQGRLSAEIPALGQSQFGRRVAERFGFQLPQEAEEEPEQESQ